MTLAIKYRQTFLHDLLLVIGIVIGGYVVGKVYEVRDFLFPESALYVNRHRLSSTERHRTAGNEVGTTDLKVEVHQGFLNAGYYSANHIAIGAIEAGID